MTKRNNMESKKIRKKKDVESVGSPLYRSQQTTLQKPRLNPLKKRERKKTFFNFDYTVGLVSEYGNKYNL